MTMDDFLKDFVLFDENYMKNIYYLGLSCDKDRTYDNRNLFFKSHDIIYRVSFIMDKVDTGFDTYITDLEVKVTDYNNVNDVIKYLDQDESTQFILPREDYDNKIICKISNDILDLDFLQINIPHVNIFSDIFMIDVSKNKDCDKNDFGIKLLKEYSIDEILAGKMLESNDKENINLEDDDYVL